MASEGYRQSYEPGKDITMPDDDMIYVAGAKLEDGNILTSGGRVVGVSATGDTLSEAIENAYSKVDKVSFSNAFYRKDIGQKALKAL